MLAFQKTIISQFSDSPVLCQWIANLNTVLDPTFNLNNFFNQLWLIDSAVGYGLDMLGRRVGVSRVITITTGDFLGFTGLTGASGDSFNAGIWFSGGTISENFSLTDDSFRQLILAKAAANITNGSIPAINQILLTLFPGRGNAYVIDNQDMTMSYVFEFALQPFELAIVLNGNVLPTPACVSATIIAPM
jgi:hypothetical protein